MTPAPGRLRVGIHERSFTVSLGDDLCFELPVACAVNATDRDEGGYHRAQDGDTVVWTGRSNLWQRKEYRLTLRDGAFDFRVKVWGEGTLGEVVYFAGAHYEFSRYFIPNPRGGEWSLPQYHCPLQSGAIAMHYQTPPLLAFPFEFAPHGWLALGLAPQPGHYNLETFGYRCTGSEGMALTTDYFGYTHVDGSYEIASIVGSFGHDEYAALAAYAEALYAHFGCRRKRWAECPRWWHGPLFCGWGEQHAMSPGDQFGGANQANYTAMSERLDALGLQPTAIIIDDKWMTTYGEALPDPAKWPDLRGFVDAEHRKGRKVMLWFKSWNTEGLAADECVGWYSLAQGADPTAPRYQQRLRDTFHTLLSAAPGCYDCDGFKVDFANVMPHGPQLRSAGGVYGIELLKRLLQLVYDTAKAVKPDCLINNSCAHPYFAEVTDQCRLHDYDGRLRNAWEVMRYRQKLYRAAMPGVPIDTDTVRSTRRETLDYIQRCGELGAPDLYFLSGTARVPFDDQFVAALRDAWAHYRSLLDGQ